ncbi:MAG TPA: metalloregulator ArsR/SmtB family transcription factor [Kribbella sp.]|jgi:DNA-binding transcriptional ArsR family regulator
MTTTSGSVVADPGELGVGQGRTVIDPTRAQLATAARTFGLLFSPVRLHLVALASCAEYDVGTLAERVGVSVATASQHLAKLRLAGLISVRREGRRHIYTVDDPHVVTLVQQIFQHVAPDGTLAPDPPRLVNARDGVPRSTHQQRLRLRPTAL